MTVSSATQIVNHYYPVKDSIVAGSKTVAVANPSLTGFCPGDLIMVYQAQGATMNTTNTVNYGDITNFNSAGLYEFNYVQSVSGSTITTQGTFTNSYSLAGKVQVIKVPQYTTLTVNAGASIIPKVWQDTTISFISYRFGGLVVVHASNIVNNGSISSNGYGFRGGATQFNGIAMMAITDYVSTSYASGGEKGESICGYQPEYDVNNGRCERGAPANGGGGGNGHNAGGGGGANGISGPAWSGVGNMIVDVNNPLSAWALDPEYIANSGLCTSGGGGRGGYSWADANSNAMLYGPGDLSWGGDYRENVGGRGGRPLTTVNVNNRIYFGGGGGVGNANNNVATNGGSGGGIVYLIATGAISGTGTINADGGTGGSTFSCSCDGASGAGGGGSIVIKTPSIASTLSVTAMGGKGGDQNFIYPLYGNVYASTPDESDGPGGGGGGGFIGVSSLVFVPVVDGGNGGITLSPAVTEMLDNGATAGAAGQTVYITPTFLSFLPLDTAISNSPVCQGSSINFTSSASISHSWIGPNGFSSFIQNPVIVNSSTLASGIYTVSFGFGTGCPVPFTQTLSVLVNPTPSVSIISSTACNASGTLTASGATSYTWNPGPVYSSSLIANAGVATVYSVSGSSTAGCIGTATAMITVPPSLTLSIAASSPSLCIGGSITLTAGSTGGTPAYSYSWTGGPLTNTRTVSAPAGSYTYVVHVTDANNCVTSASVSVDFVALPAVSVADVSVCSGSTGTLTALGASTYTWNAPAFTGNPFMDAPTVTTNYTVTGSAAGCTATAAASIFVWPAPTAFFTPSAITCASLGSAMVSITGGIGPFTQTWMPTAQTTTAASGMYPGTYTLTIFDAGVGCTYADSIYFAPLVPFTGTVSATDSLVCNGIATGTAGIALSGGSGSQTYAWSNVPATETTSLASALSAGIHTVTVTDGLTYCVVTHTFQILQPFPLSLVVSATPSISCVNSPVVLNAGALGGTPAYTYSWTGGPATFYYLANAATGGNYTYSVQGKDAYNCTANGTVAVRFVDYPVLSATSLTACAGSPASLTVLGADTYTWVWAQGNSTGSVVTINQTTAGTNNYTITGDILGCERTTTAVLFTDPLPVPIVSSNNSICEGQALLLIGSGNGSYSWNGPLGFSSAAADPTINAVSLIHAGTYSLTVTDTYSCSATTSTLITILPNPTVTVWGAEACIGNGATIKASGGVSYFWTGPGGFSSGDSSAVIPSVSGTTIYTVDVTGANGCQLSRAVTVIGDPFPLPVPLITVTPGACVNTPINLQGSGGSTYLWRGPDGFISHNQNPVFSPGTTQAGGVYTLTIVDQNNCIGTATAPLAIYPLPGGQLILSPNEGCVPLCTDLSFIPSGNSASVSSTNFSIGSLATSPIGFNYCIQKPGSYEAKVVYTDANGCSNTSSLVLTVYPKPKADFTFAPLEPTEGLDAVVFTDASMGNQVQAWNWFFTNEAGSESEHPSYLYQQAGSYPVALIIRDSRGCTDTVVKVIYVGEDFNIYIPNSFTPNGDGLNDAFQPKGSGVVSYKMDIYDRWGTPVFGTTDFLKGWDGTYKGQDCKIDVYTWKISITTSNNSLKHYEGPVTLIR